MENFIVSRSTDNLAAAADSDVLYIEDLAPGAICLVSEEVNNGTVTGLVKWSPDGVTYYTLGSSITEASSFPVMAAIEDAGDNPLPAKYLKFVATVYTGTGEYKLTAAGRQLKGFASASE